MRSLVPCLVLMLWSVGLLSCGDSGGSPASNSSSPTPDTVAPTVSLTTPVNGALVSGAVPITIAAQDNVGVLGVQFQLDGNNLGAEDMAFPYSITWGATVASNGPHILTAVARDVAGNTQTSVAVSVIVSNGGSLGKTITSASCSESHVQAAIDEAKTGDTVKIPAGSCAWIHTVSVGDPTTATGTKAIVLQGAGVNRTIIIDEVDKEDSTRPSANFLSHALAVFTIPGALTRVTGITFDGGTGLPDMYNKGMVLIAGTSKSWRLDHCHFKMTRTAALQVHIHGGVVDHNIFDVLVVGSGGLPGLVYGFGAGDTYGDTGWADTTDLGTDKAFFLEDNLFRSPVFAGGVSVAQDGWIGERVIFRYNTLEETWFANHGTESSGRFRGARTFEVYENTIHISQSFPSAVGIRSGVGLVFNNRVTGSVAHIASLQAQRADTPRSIYVIWGGGCNGTSPWDGNRQANGYPCLDQPGYGHSDLISGNNPNPVGWPNQKLEPTYAWGNTLNGNPGGMVSHTPTHIVEGRDFFNVPKPGYTPYPYPHPLNR